jgi:hypothetical protein
MKKHFSKIALLSVIIMAVSFSVSAQIYVTVRPHPPVVVRAVAPSPAHVWIDEDWEERGGQYAYVGGHWALPPHRGYIWFPGHWKAEGRRGERWVKGRWGRR